MNCVPKLHTLSIEWRFICCASQAPAKKAGVYSHVRMFSCRLAGGGVSVGELVGVCRYPRQLLLGNEKLNPSCPASSGV
jgi:hypothetical protein